MTGLEVIDGSSKMLSSHVQGLSCRLEENLNFKILIPRGRISENSIVSDFVAYIEEGSKVYDNLVLEILDAAVVLANRKYERRQPLFDDLSSEEAGVYLFKLKQVLAQRRENKDFNIEGFTADEIAESLFQELKSSGDYLN